MLASLMEAVPDLVNVWWHDDDDSPPANEMRSALQQVFAELDIDVQVGVSTLQSSALQEAWRPDGVGLVWGLPSPRGRTTFDVVCQAAADSMALRHWRPALLAAVAEKLLNEQSA